MRRMSIIGIAASLLTLLCMVSAQAADHTASLPETHLPLLREYCFDCHDADTQKGKIDLESQPLKITTLQEAELWQKVLNAMNAGEMPPEKKRQPDNNAKADFLDALAQTMVAARQSLSDSGGKITMRRLNRREYRNTIEQLTGSKIDINTLPADGGGGTFDTIGSSQFVSSDQIEQYLKLGRSAVDEMFERHAAQKREPIFIRIEPEKTVNPANEKEVSALEDSYSRFRPWQEGVDKAAATPANQKKIEELGKKTEQIKHPIHFYKFANQLEGAPDPKEFGFRDVPKAALANPDWDRGQLAYHKHYLTLPHRDRGTYLKLAHGIGRIDITPKKLSPGTYILRIKAGAVEGAPPSRRFIEIGHPQRRIPRQRGLDGAPISKHQITGSIEDPQIIETRLEVGADTIKEFAVQERQPTALKALWDAHNVFKKSNGYGHPPAIWIDWIEFEGPITGSGNTSLKQRRQVEEHANTKVGGTYNGYFKGGYEKALAFRKTGKPQKGIIDEQEAKFRIRRFNEEGPTFRRYLEDPLTQSGSFLTISAVNKEEFIALPPEHPSGWRKTKHIVETVPPGNYKLRFRIASLPDTPSHRHFVDLGSVPGDKQFNQIGTFQITGTTENPQVVEVDVSLTADSPRKFALREKRDPKGDLARYRKARHETGVGPKPALWVDWVEWEGPLGESNMDWWVSDRPNLEEEVRARRILENFSIRAMRGSEPGIEFIDRLMGIFANRRALKEPFNMAIRSPLSIILASPGFLYLYEPGAEDQSRHLSDRELAVRLAYFLWSAPPDQGLLDLAETAQLSTQATLRQQINRMINDPRSDEFVSGFVHQWLDMERLDFFQFDVKRHREFDEGTRAATRQEVYHSFTHLLRGGKNGRLGNFLKSDYVMINGLLATYYGIDGVIGDEFRLVHLPPNSPRGGLLGMAAVHAMGSDGVESSPVERGAWVLRHLLNDPPPPAPPNVPQLSRLAGKPLTTRERLAAHQEEPQCASCHRKIDPIGFGLENFNAAGKWRTTEGIGKRSHTINPSGSFHNGPEFTDFFKMRDLIAQREADFARGFTEHLIEYALGRPFGFTDEPLLDDIVKKAEAHDYSISSFIQALVLSEPFQVK